MQSSPGQVVTQANITEYFRQSVASAMDHQQLAAAEETVSYVVRLLASFARSETLFEQTPEGVMQKPLALFYAEAISAESTESRNYALRRLGDVALFVAGVFTDSLNRRVVDVDYYISMGGNAYAHLGEQVGRAVDRICLGQVFAELAAKFAEFVDVLGEVTDHTHLHSNADILRLYELWVRTGSQRAERKLRDLGVHPVACGTGGFCH